MKTKNVQLTIWIIILAVLLAFTVFFAMLFTVSASVAYASDEGISALSDVSVDDVRTRYDAYDGSYVMSNVPEDNQYYDSTLTNDANNGILKDDVYSWANGVNVMNNNINQLVFKLNLRNPNFEQDIGMRTVYVFDIYKASRDTNTADKIFSIGFVVMYKLMPPDEWSYAVGVKQFAYGQEKFSIAGLDKNITNQSTQDSLSSSNDYFNSFSALTTADYSIVGCSDASSLILPCYGDIEKCVHVIIDTPNLTDEYFVKLDYSFYADSDSHTSCLCSRIASVYDIVKQMDKRHELGFLTEDAQAQATTLINDGSVEKVQVAWLERIGDTPFARKKYDYVEVPVTSNMLSPGEVANALGLETLAVGQSSCQYFKEDSATGIFHAYYLKNVWLSSKDANGNSMNLFLDINVSYKDFYYPFVRDGIFTQGMYEWFWSTMIVKYPEISGIDDADLYGYFGYTSVPYTYTLNQLIYEMFDGSPNMDGVVRYFSYRENLDYDSYIKLLDDYQYGWLEKAWNSVAGFFSGSKYPADHYFFYCDGEEDNAFIGENGADSVYDNSSAFVNGVEDVAETVSDLFTKYEDVFTFVLGFIGIFIFLFFFFYLTTKIVKLKTAVNRFKTSQTEKQRAYDNKRKNKKHKYKRH